jgi:hypothetical protein
MRQLNIAAFLLVSLAALLGSARASRIDKNIVTLPNGSMYVKLTVAYDPQQSLVGDHHLTDSYSAYSLVKFGRGIVWSVTSIGYYKGQVMDVRYAPETIKLSDISQGFAAGEVYTAACPKD